MAQAGSPPKVLNILLDQGPLPDQLAGAATDGGDIAAVDEYKIRSEHMNLFEDQYRLYKSRPRYPIGRPPDCSRLSLPLLRALLP